MLVYSLLRFAPFCTFPALGMSGSLFEFASLSRYFPVTLCCRPFVVNVRYATCNMNERKKLTTNQGKKRDNVVGSQDEVDSSCGPAGKYLFFSAQFPDIWLR